MSDLIISGKDSVTGQNREAELSDQFIDKTGTQVLATEASVAAAIAAATGALNSLSEILSSSTDGNITNGNDIIIVDGDELIFGTAAQIRNFTTSYQYLGYNFVAQGVRFRDVTNSLDTLGVGLDNSADLLLGAPYDVDSPAIVIPRNGYIYWTDGDVTGQYLNGFQAVGGNISIDCKSLILYETTGSPITSHTQRLLVDNGICNFGSSVLAFGELTSIPNQDIIILPPSATISFVVDLIDISGGPLEDAIRIKLHDKDVVAFAETSGVYSAVVLPIDGYFQWVSGDLSASAGTSTTFGEPYIWRPYQGVLTVGNGTDFDGGGTPVAFALEGKEAKFRFMDWFANGGSTFAEYYRTTFNRNFGYGDQDGDGIIYYVGTQPRMMLTREGNGSGPDGFDTGLILPTNSYVSWVASDDLKVDATLDANAAFIGHYQDEMWLGAVGYRFQTGGVDPTLKITNLIIDAGPSELRFGSVIGTSTAHLKTASWDINWGSVYPLTGMAVTNGAGVDRIRFGEDGLNPYIVMQNGGSLAFTSGTSLDDPIDGAIYTGAFALPGITIEGTRILFREQDAIPGTTFTSRMLIDGGIIDVGPHPIQFGSAIGVTGPILRSGTGSPESVVTAEPGSIYTDRDGGAGITLYIKESGSGNTGWIAK